MRRVLVAMVVAGLWAGACGGEAETTADGDRATSRAKRTPTEEQTPKTKPSPSIDFGHGTAVLHGASDVRVELEVARTAEQRAFGLMLREELAPEAGMLFVFPGATSGGFYMKDTLIPLSIAFFDDKGEILKILDMVPCKREPCKIYYPDAIYTRALEVNKAAFDRWEVTTGDSIELDL